MTKNLTKISLALALVFGLTACGTKPAQETPNEEGKTTGEVVPFSAEYEMVGTTSSGKPKNDTFVFEGETTDGIITKLNFDIIRNKGTEGEYSKKDLMGYLMNISDATIEKVDDNFKLTTLTAYGYDTAYAEGAGAQFMVSASIDKLTDETTFKELTFKNDATSTPEQIVEVPMDKALLTFQYVATEAGIETLTEDTLVKDLISKHGLNADGSFVEGTKRISFAGYNGGRSYGEQIDAIVAYILDNKMTLEEVYEMFKTENQQTTDIKDRDAITGATITFVGDFARTVYMAINGEIFEGVVTHTTADDKTVVEVVTQGYGGEIETHITFDKDAKITDIKVRDANETAEIGAVLTAEGSDFINSVIAGQDDVTKVDAATGATVTSNALTKAVQFAQEYVAGLSK
ncbi:FMN-binding protein [Anaerorhabdus sp.]|uniref:FMN-binding protein n=1 Tax=Anaerorhabdus sp. TaxID=1872524 RepID=UPI002FC8F037